MALSHQRAYSRLQIFSYIALKSSFGYRVNIACPYRWPAAFEQCLFRSSRNLLGRIASLCRAGGLHNFAPLSGVSCRPQDWKPKDLTESITTRCKICKPPARHNVAIPAEKVSTAAKKALLEAAAIYYGQGLCEPVRKALRQYTEDLKPRISRAGAREPFAPFTDGGEKQNAEIKGALEDWARVS